MPSKPQPQAVNVPSIASLTVLLALVAEAWGIVGEWLVYLSLTTPQESSKNPAEETELNHCGTGVGERCHDVTDHLGTVTAITNEAGVTVWTGDYTPFGQLAGANGELKFSGIYTGKDMDEATGLTYYWNRWQNPETGRFMSEDPIRDGSNFYGYVGNRVMVAYDQTGLEIVFINGGGSSDLGHTLENMQGYRNAIASMLEQLGDNVEPTADGSYRSSEFGNLDKRIYRHNGAVSGVVNPENITVLAREKFKDKQADGLVGWSMGGDTAVEYALQTEKNDFDFIILDGAQTLTAEAIEIIAAKTKILIIVDHEDDFMTNNEVTLGGDRVYGNNYYYGPTNKVSDLITRRRDEREFGAEAKARKLPNVHRITVPGGHDPAVKETTDLLSKLLKEKKLEEKKKEEENNGQTTGQTNGQ